MTTTTTRSWREIVEAADDENRQRDSLYPTVYTFGGRLQKRDSGPAAGVYAYRVRADNALVTADHDRAHLINASTV